MSALCLIASLTSWRCQVELERNFPRLFMFCYKKTEVFRPWIFLTLHLNIYRSLLSSCFLASFKRIPLQPITILLFCSLYIIWHSFLCPICCTWVSPVRKYFLLWVCENKSIMEIICSSTACHNHQAYACTLNQLRLLSVKTCTVSTWQNKPTKDRFKYFIP